MSAVLSQLPALWLQFMFLSREWFSHIQRGIKIRCVSCNCALTDFESTRKGALSGDYLDLCNSCIKGLNIATLDRPDLEGSFTSIYEDPDYDDYGTIIPDGMHTGWLMEDDV